MPLLIVAGKLLLVSLSYLLIFGCRKAAVQSARRQAAEALGRYVGFWLSLGVNGPTFLVVA